MFDKIEIQRFRGIEYASIKGFKLTSLFFGNNNYGKSFLLESGHSGIEAMEGPSNSLS